MFKPQKPTPNQPMRHKLPLVERPPRQEDVATLFTGAQRIRGTIFEMPIKPDPHGRTFTITCQFDHNANSTVWSMLEADGTALWNIPQGDLDLVFDMVVMACQQGASSSSQTRLPPELAPPPGSLDQASNDQYSGASKNSQGYPSPGQPGQAGYPDNRGQGAQQGYNQQNQQYPNQNQGQQQQQYPNQQYPNQQSQPYQQQPNQYQNAPQQQQYPNQSPNPNQQYPNQQNPNQGYGQGQQQQPYNPNGYPPQQQQAPQQGYGNGPSPSQQAPIWNPPQPTAPAPSAGQGYSNSNTAPELTNFIDLLNKGQPNLLLGHLFVEAGLMPERCLDAALKLQELVRIGKLDNAQAILALKRASELGGNLDDSIIEWARDPERKKKPSQPAGSFASTTPAASANPGAASSRPGVDPAISARIVDLLKQAGLVSDADVETASKVKSKHGGDLGQILVSAGKIGGKTLEAAGECQEYIRFGRLRIDKAIMSLHYCERMRVGLKEALGELSIELT